MSIKAMYDKTMNVFTKARVPDGLGGQTTNKTAHLTNVACYLEVKKGEEKEYSGSEGPISDHLLFCSVIDIDSDMWVVINGVTYDVVFVDDQQRRSHHLEIDLLQRKNS